MASMPVTIGISALYLKDNLRRAAIPRCDRRGGVRFPHRIRAHRHPRPPDHAAQRRHHDDADDNVLDHRPWRHCVDFPALRDYTVERLKAANAEVVESASRSRIALEAAKVGLWDVPNAELRRFHVSESFQSITGLQQRRDERTSSAMSKASSIPEDAAQLSEAFALGRSRMSRIRVGLPPQDPSARLPLVLGTGARYSRNEDGTVRISGSLQDINFIKAAEDALRTGRDRAREAQQGQVRLHRHHEP